jgi:Rps23 Pro-64 3,4-dihydroxylase Tpa1-like proline 4-hydroxylase
MTNQLKDHIIKQIQSAELICGPIDHIVVDSFLPEDFARDLSNEFGDYDGDHWHKYSNMIEEKRTCNQWNLFKPKTYTYFQIICSDLVNTEISKKFNIEVEADYGLHGGGQHIHSKMGNLNPHLDYSIHPKIGAERRLNAIYYLTDQHEESDGGHFGLWDNSSASEPGDLVKEYAPIFNRLVLFNTSQKSWHGLSRVYKPKLNRYRKSLATYYVSTPREDSLSHTRAYFAPRAEQLNDQTVLDQIIARVTENGREKVYVVQK